MLSYVWPASSLTLADRIVPRSRAAGAQIALVAGGALLLALSARIAIPLKPVPITGQTFAVLLLGAALGSRRGAASVGTYVGLGALGLPVFARAGGVATYGYLGGFIVAAFIVGLLAERGWDRRFVTAVGAMLIGEAAIYAVALPWLAHFVGGYNHAITVGLLPFIPGDTLKLLAAALALPGAWSVVRRDES